MSDKIEPALTAEEWDQFKARKLDLYAHFVDDSRPHAIAATSLYGQPFGFTREDVKFLMFRYTASEDVPENARYKSIADRISALLPSREAPRDRI